MMSGTLDDASDLSPNVEFFCRNKVKWLGEVEGAQTHETHEVVP